ncbi:ABC-three component system protein [Exiguobacterium artemiae]
MNAYEINQVNNLLENNNLSPLIPSSLLSFKKYINSAFNGYYKEVESIFKSNAKKLLQITPKDIAYGHKEKLYLPSESEWKKLLQNEEFWKGWLEVLTYNYLETGNIPVFKNDILQIYRNGKTHTQNIRLFFSDSENIHTVSSQFYHENIQNLSKNEIIIINSEKAMKGKIKVTEKDFEGRLEDISQPYKLQVYEESFDIYKTLYQKNTKFYHLNYFRQLISDIEIDPKIDINDTMITLKDSIKEFFKDV